jgi:hypothetical protein
MKIEALKKRLNKNRPMTEITLNIPDDVLEDLKRVALKLQLSYGALCYCYCALRVTRLTGFVRA